MKNNRQEETIRAYFAREQVPEQVHQKLTETFRLLEERPVKKRRPVWKGVAVSFSTVAAAFVLLCGVNAVNPAFAESLPLVGEAFRLYNGERKLGVGSYVGTYDEIELVNAPAEEENAQGMGLTLNEAYSDGEFIHLSFTMGNVPEQVMDDLFCLSGLVTSQANGTDLKEDMLTLHPQGEVLSGTVAIPVEGEPADGTVLEVTYQVTDLIRTFADGGSREELEGSFSGEAAVTVDTSHNQRYDAFASDSEVQINWVESTPSYTRINYTIPYWGTTHYTLLGIPELYLEDGTPLQRSWEEGGERGFGEPDGPAQEAETVTHTAFFDGLPQGTEKVILRFFEEQTDWDPATRTAPEVYYVADDTMEITPYTVGVLAEVTIDLATGEAVPSETYLEYGVSSVADTYQDSFKSLYWFIHVDDTQAAELGQSDWASLTALPGLFQNGETLHTLEYDKASRELDVIFATDGSQPASDLTVTVADSQGNPLAVGQLAAATAEHTSGETWDYYTWEASFTLEEGKELRQMDDVTVTLTDPNSGEQVYQRQLRLTNREIT